MFFKWGDRLERADFSFVRQQVFKSECRSSDVFAAGALFYWWLEGFQLCGFDDGLECVQQDVVTWTTMILGHLRFGQGFQALEPLTLHMPMVVNVVSTRMLLQLFSPNPLPHFSYLLTFCTQSLSCYQYLLTCHVACTNGFVSMLHSP